MYVYMYVYIYIYISQRGSLLCRQNDQKPTNMNGFHSFIDGTFLCSVTFAFKMSYFSPHYFNIKNTNEILLPCILISQVLRAGGATDISCYVTHAVFPNESWRKFTEPELNVRNFWITDSIPHSHQIGQHPPFKLLSLADVIVDVLWGYDLTQ